MSGTGLAALRPWLWFSDFCAFHWRKKILQVKKSNTLWNPSNYFFQSETLEILCAFKELHVAILALKVHLSFGKSLLLVFLLAWAKCCRSSVPCPWLAVHARDRQRTFASLKLSAVACCSHEASGHQARAWQSWPELPEEDKLELRSSTWRCGSTRKFHINFAMKIRFMPHVVQEMWKIRRKMFLSCSWIT